jgi:beta-phosphoglucomutase-like phosphatase (HAD superfamily)
MRSAPNSTRRAATCAGPTRAAAAIAAVVLAPAISSRRGRCAAMAPVTNHVAAKTKARSARGRGKPAPDIFLEASRRLRVPPGDCTVFEDSDEGLEAARLAGMTTTDVRLVYRPAWRFGV